MGLMDDGLKTWRFAVHVALSRGNDFALEEVFGGIACCQARFRSSLSYLVTLFLTTSWTKLIGKKNFFLKRDLTRNTKSHFAHTLRGALFDTSVNVFKLLSADPLSNAHLALLTPSFHRPLPGPLSVTTTPESP